MDGVQVGRGLFRGAHVGFRNDLKQWGACAIQVNAGHASNLAVQRFACILFKVGMVHADGLSRAVVERNVDAAAAHRGLFHLAGLVAFGQIRIEVVLAFKDGALWNLGVNRKAKAHRHCDGFLVKHGQCAGHAKVDNAGLSVWLSAEGGR